MGKIESGSIWAQVFGESRVIGLMIRLIESAVHYFHRNFTNEGKVIALPRKAEAVEQLLQLRTQLAATGLNLHELDERITKAAVLVSEQFTALLGDEPQVSVNRVELSVSAEMLAAIARLGHVPLLEGAAEVEADGSPGGVKV